MGGRPVRRMTSWEWKYKTSFCIASLRQKQIEEIGQTVVRKSAILHFSDRFCRDKDKAKMGQNREPRFGGYKGSGIEELDSGAVFRQSGAEFDRIGRK